MQNKPEKPPIPKPPKQFKSLKPKTEETPAKASPKPSINKLKTVANMMMVLGFLTMTSVLLGYETTICKKGAFDFLDDECTYNIGKIGKKNDLIMFGGFLFLGGCILFNNEECRK